MKNRKTIFVILIAVVSVAVLAAIWIKEPNKDQMMDAFLSMNPIYLIAAVLTMAFYVCVDGFNMWIMVKKMAKMNIGLGYCLKIGLIGRTYCAITPFGTGGQPYYVYSMKKKGVDASAATSIIIVKYIIHQSVYILLAIFAICVAYYYRALSAVVWAFIGVGLIANIFLPAMAILFSKKKKWLDVIIVWLSKVLTKLRLLKKREGLEETVKQYTDTYRQGIDVLVHKPALLWIIALTTLIELVVFLVVPYFIRLSFGTPSVGFIQFMCVYFLLYLAICVMPTPGGAGFAEGGFYLIFESLFPAAAITPALMLWRGITYYLLLLSGGVAIVADSVCRIFRRKREGRKCLKN